MTFTPRPFGGLFVCVCFFRTVLVHMQVLRLIYCGGIQSAKKHPNPFVREVTISPGRLFFFFSPADKISLLKCLSLQHGGTGIEIPDFLCKMLSHFNALLNRRLFFLLPQPKVPFYYTVFPRTSFSGCL